MAGKRNRSIQCFAVMAIMLLLCSAGPGQKKGGNRIPSNNTNQLKDLVERADFLLRTDDTSDVADQLYKQIVEKYPTSFEAGYAQLNRANYWQRKFYIVKAKTGVEDKRALTSAESEFYNFLKKFGQSSNYDGLVADAHFNLALVYLQQGNRDNAIGWLNIIISNVSKRDPEVYVNKVVWSPDSRDLLDRKVNSRNLAEETKKLIEKNPSFDKVLSGIRAWCRKQ
jgi:tetratricopeptide (TPR) repeat protein